MTGAEFADKIGITYSSYRTMTSKNAKAVPKWVTAFLFAWKWANDEDLLCIECQVEENGHGIGFMFCKNCIDD